MRKFLILTVLFLTGCASPYETTKNECKQQSGISRIDDFYIKLSSKQVNHFFGCMKTAPRNDTDLLVINMQESLWHQILDKTKTPAQAQQEYTTFMQTISSRRQNIRTTTTTNCFGSPPFVSCSSY